MPDFNPGNAEFAFALRHLCIVLGFSALVDDCGSAFGCCSSPGKNTDFGGSEG